jgi:hypothetical protein
METKGIGDEMFSFSTAFFRLFSSEPELGVRPKRPVKNSESYVCGKSGMSTRDFGSVLIGGDSTLALSEPRSAAQREG